MTLVRHYPVDLIGPQQQRPDLTLFSRRGYRLAALAVLLGTVCMAAQGQIGDGTSRVSSASAFMMVGGENTQLPAYADNALGFDLGVSIQPHALLGAEFSAGAYPFSAKYVQIPFTGGYRIAGRSFFGFPYAPFAYIGGGVSRSQDKGTGHAAYPPEWQKCWQADIGFDRNYRSFSWRVAQASWRETYTPVHNLRSLGLSTGIVYRFAR